MFVENIKCPACIQTIEKTLNALPGVESSRLNFSTQRVTVRWTNSKFDPRDIVAALERKGYHAVPYDPALLSQVNAQSDSGLLRAVAISGFAAANIMLLSVSIWAGNASGDMGPATRDLLHWVSALIALPVIVIAGRPFFQSAWGALTNRRMNMDVPISLAVILAGIMSTAQTAMSAEHAYFDAAVMLLFFLLIGRYLDHSMRARTRSVATDLLALQGAAATVIGADGSRRSVPARELKIGDRLEVLPGDSIPADGKIVHGRSDVDMSLVSGESTPVAAYRDIKVFAGTVNLTGPLQVLVTADAENTLLADIVRLLENVEQAKTKYTHLADQAARVYAPAVHVIAGLTLAGWLIAGAGWFDALSIATAVLIITCPCALGLAVPAVQVVAASRLMRYGVLVKSADALEQLATVDTVVLDKTGTLTEGRPVLINEGEIDPDVLSVAAGLARGSRHPLAAAIARRVSTGEPVGDIVEQPGEGLTGVWRGVPVYLGRAEWVCPEQAPSGGSTEVWCRIGDQTPVRFRFEDRLKEDAQSTVAQLKTAGLRVHILSGDRKDVVERLATVVKADQWEGELTPVEKIARVEALEANGHRVLMVGDGLNDAPALAAATVSMSPAEAAEISQIAADMIIRGKKLGAVADAVKTARATRRAIKQNFSLAIVYNVLAVPIAVAGLVTPLIAAIAMSSSSIIVTLNALRLKWRMR